jgi:ABC-type uncharacterized transport system auxiliary subunit
VNKNLIVVLLSLLLVACVEIPGSDTSPADRYSLQAGAAATGSCKTGSTALTLVVANVGTGLDNNRIATRNANSGEITYLRGMRWAESTGQLVQQQLAVDLECRGYTVSTSHHRRLNRNQLLCEVRAFNLLEDSAGKEGEVSLSCSYLQTANQGELLLKANYSSKLRSWSADNAVAAIREAYRETADDILGQLP